MRLRTRIALMVALAALLVCSAGVVLGASMILNEYNAVKSAAMLGGATSTAADPYFGRVAGNGGDWMEFVVIQDMLDVRGWSFVTTQNGVDDATIVLPSLSVFSALRSGTIFTIAEDVATDLSYSPVYDPANAEAGDWWINYQASFSPEISGSATNDNFQVTILDALGNVIFGPAGEGIKPASGIGSDEVFKLEADPTDLITPFSNYKDGSSSTFGAANRWSSGTITQDFSELRSNVVPEPASMLALLCGISPLVVKGLRRRGK